MTSKDFFGSLAPFNKREGFIAITSGRHVTIFSPIGPDIELEGPADTLTSVLIAPSDNYALLLGGKEHLNLYMVDLTVDQPGSPEPYKLKLDCPKLYNYNPADDAACLMGEGGSDDQLLISFRDGRSVIFSLENARRKDSRTQTMVDTDHTSGSQ